MPSPTIICFIITNFGLLIHLSRHCLATILHVSPPFSTFRHVARPLQRKLESVHLAQFLQSREMTRNKEDIPGR